MFNWLGNLFPYSDLHSLNLDWILNKMKETAAQAAKAIADSANALAQVVEAKTAAQNAQTASQNAQTAADNAADSAENAVSVAQSAKSAAQTAQNTANTAQTVAQTAQNTANTAKTAAETAQNTANTAQTVAQTAQTAAETAQSDIDTISAKFPIKSVDIASKAITSKKLEKNSFAITTKGDTSGLAYFTNPQGADVSGIADVLTDSSIYDFIRLTVGHYLQFIVDVYNGNIANRNKNIVFDFHPAYYDKSEDLPLCIPFIFMNKTENKVIKGYAKFLHTETYKYTFQMFFDEPPVFPENSKFVGKIRNIGAYMVEHF